MDFESELETLTSTELYDKGMDYSCGRNGVRKDYEKTLRCFTKAADLGNALAMEQIGYMYNFGWGVARSKIRAWMWYRRAAKIGDVNLGNQYAYYFVQRLEEGYEVEQNLDKAIFWFRKSAELGNKNAMFELAVLLFKYKKNETEAMDWLIKYNDGSEVGVKMSLAGIYRWRLKEPKKAFEIYKEVAEQGEDCYYTLGEMYSKGEGTERNVHEAIKWYEKAAQIEVINDLSDEYCKWDSMLKIAEIYVGLKDETKALEWLTKRNDGNKLQGMGELAHIYYGDDDFEYEDRSLIDKEKAFEWFEKLYELKDSHGTYYFAEMWESKSTNKALQVYKDGVEFGSERCCQRIIQLYLESGNIPEAASWTVKYFEMADAELCENLCRNPFIELKQIANFFIETPLEELIQLYGGDRELVAGAIYNFKRACDKTLVNLYTKLELMSIVADLLGDNCPRELLETLTESYKKVYQEVRDNGVSDEIEGDEYELRLKKLLDSGESSSEVESKATEKSYHDVEYYKEKFLYFKSKLMVISVRGIMPEK